MLKSKTVLAGMAMLLKGVMVPVIIGGMVTLFHYPLAAYDCHKYGDNKELPVKYSWFECYVKPPHKGWFTKQEYVQSQIGTKLVVEKEIE